MSRRIRVVIPANEYSGGVARELVTGKRLNLCYQCGLPEDEHSPECPKESETQFVDDAEYFLALTSHL